MTDGIPAVTDFAFTPDTPECPRCGGPMDQGELRAGNTVYYIPSQAPGWSDAAKVHARSCIACGYPEVFTDPEELRCIMAGAKPARP